MAPKNFAVAPKPPKAPTDAQIAQFERGGSGHDRREEEFTRPQKAVIGPTKRLSLDLPQSLHTRFKTACSATNRKMVGELQALIQARTAELEDEAGIDHQYGLVVNPILGKDP